MRLQSLLQQGGTWALSNPFWFFSARPSHLWDFHRGYMGRLNREPDNNFRLALTGMMILSLELNPNLKLEENASSVASSWTSDLQTLICLEQIVSARQSFCYKSSALVGRAGISHFSSLTYGLRLGIRNCRDNHSVPTSRRFPKCSLCITSLIVYARTGGLTYPEVAHITSHHIYSNPICEFRVVQPSIFHDCATRTLAWHYVSIIKSSFSWSLNQS